ncbi:MAG: Glutamine-dependent NAD(+) synthetase [Phycisphaerae bacterium]|nr:Glutamine-dependent NAD(+) synthetase [Phycisphaerae bacterium]
MKIALAQFNPTVGDIAGNARRIAAMIDQAADAGADLIATPELGLLGYPPKDLLLKPQVVADNLRALDELAARCTRIAALVGFAKGNLQEVGRPLRNCVALLAGGRVVSRHAKQLLPTYDIFDESRYFEPGDAVQVADLGGRKLGLTICEDLWSLARVNGRRLYDTDPVGTLAKAGAEVVINISASPFVVGKHAVRTQLFAEQARANRVPVLYVNQVGGNDELVFDGASCAFAADGRLIAQARDFEEDLLLVDVGGRGPGAGGEERISPVREGVASVHAALVLGLRDYCRKCGFTDVLLGLSGGIDSAVTATLAVDALGAGHVHGVAMPSRYSSGHSLEDAAAVARNLGIDYRVIPIDAIHGAFESSLAPAFADSDQPPGTAEENIQARVRGNILMSISNKFGYMVLSTGNKSELAVGYCTLYGDMSGGLAVISDVPKTMVYKLAEWLNRDGERIPRRSITKPPSAELKPDQTDQDSLPPYEVLDAILERYVEQEQSAAQIVAAGFGREVVARVVRMVDVNEYKRKQAAPGLKVTGRAFGTGRRMPIAQRYRPLPEGDFLS